MSHINDSTQLINIFGFPSYDNFREPVPFTNRSSSLIGFTSAFLVCCKTLWDMTLRADTDCLRHYHGYSFASGFTFG
jgi:hypothetical protein